MSDSRPCTKAEDAVIQAFLATKQAPELLELMHLSQRGMPKQGLVIRLSCLDEKGERRNETHLLEAP